MSRTHRNLDAKWYRRPQTKNEKSQLDSLLHDPELSEYSSGMNHMKRRQSRVPTSWDDIRVSGNHEDYRKWHNLTD